MNNRIDSLSINATIPRQTPKNDFGTVLSSTVNGMVRMGGAIINSVTGMPVVSAAVSAVTSFANSGGRAQSQSAATAGGTAIPVANVPGGGSGGAAGSLYAGNSSRADKYSDPTLNEMQITAEKSLHLQMEIQQESREFNAISNVLKVRHDSAKAAINNVR